MLYTHSPSDSLNLMSYEQIHTVGRKTKALSRKKKKDGECEDEESAPALPSSQPRLELCDHRSTHAGNQIQLPMKSAHRNNDAASTIAERLSSPTSISFVRKI